MKKWKIGIGCGLVLLPLLLLAQEKTTSKSRVGFEFGGNVFFGEAIVPDQVRTSKSVYEYEDFFCGISASDQVLENLYGGIKYESFFWKDRLGLAVGLRFSQFSAEINTDWDRKYFIWLFRQNETTTDYLTLQSIKQKNYYLGIPLEFRYLPKRRDSFFKQYLKLGANVNYRLSTINSIAFYDPAMSKYAGAVGAEIGKPSLFNAWIYPAYGFKFGKMKNVWFNMEIDFPGLLIGEKSHPLFRADAGMGMQISVQIPL